jgi:hypothetical protein
VRGEGLISAECHKAKISKGGREQGEMSIKRKRGGYRKIEVKSIKYM